MLGHYDAMGVWITGEDDAFPSASTWLNRLAGSVSDALKRQYDVNTAPTDAAVAALFGTPGSATRTAARTDEFDARLDSLEDDRVALTARVGNLEDKQIGDIKRTAFVPQWTNLALGTGSAILFAEYSVTKGRCKGTVLLRLGTGLPTGTTYMRYPVAPATALIDSLLPIGGSMYVDVSASVRQPGIIYMGTVANGMRIALVNTAGTYESFTDLTAAIPFAWATSDLITLDFDYPTL